LLWQDWSASSHASPRVWPAIAAWSALGLCAVGYVALLTRACVHRRRYRAAGALAESDLAALHEELVAAEKKTVGEIVPVVLERSDEHPAAGWLAALCGLLAGGALFTMWRPVDSPALLFLLQLAPGVLG